MKVVEDYCRHDDPSSFWKTQNSFHSQQSKLTSYVFFATSQNFNVWWHERGTRVTNSVRRSSKLYRAKYKKKKRRRVKLICNCLVPVWKENKHMNNRPLPATVFGRLFLLRSAFYIISPPPYLSRHVLWTLCEVQEWRTQKCLHPSGQREFTCIH